MNSDDTSNIPAHFDEGDGMRMPRPGKTLFGMTRTHLYSLWKQGCIRSITVHPTGKKQGIRLVSRSSIVEFLAKLDLEQNGKKEGESQ